MAILPDEKQTKLTKPISTVGYFQMQQRAIVNIMNIGSNIYLLNNLSTFVRF